MRVLAAEISLALTSTAAMSQAVAQPRRTPEAVETPDALLRVDPMQHEMTPNGSERASGIAKVWERHPAANVVVETDMRAIACPEHAPVVRACHIVGFPHAGCDWGGGWCIEILDPEDDECAIVWRDADRIPFPHHGASLLKTLA